MPELTLHPHQDRVLDSKARFIGVVSGIRGGKTTIGAIWLCDRIQADRNAGRFGDYLIAAPTNKMLDQATLPKFKEFFPADWGTWKEQKGYFQLNWNRPGTTEPCRIFVRSMDEPDSVEGMECLAAWIDECGKIKGQGWINIQGRLSVTQGPCLMTTTPYAINWFYREVCKRAEASDPDYEVINFASIDNPAFPKDEYERAKRTLPKAIFERRYMGKFTRLEGLVYPEFNEDLHVVESFPIPENWPRFAGLDFGASAPNAIVCITQDPETKKFYVYKEFYANETLLKTISTFLHNEKFDYVLADTQAAQNILELQKFYGNTNIKEADKAIEVGVERIRMLLIENKIAFFNGKTEKTVEEFLEYHYPPPDEDKVQKDKPVKKKDHAMDALRYAFSKPMAGLYAHHKNIRRGSGRQVVSRRLHKPDPYTGY